VYAVEFELKEHEYMTEEVERGMIEEMREKLMGSQVLAQLQLFQSED
jgi:hypothetical protein